MILAPSYTGTFEILKRLYSPFWLVSTWNHTMSWVWWILHGLDAKITPLFTHLVFSPSGLERYGRDHTLFRMTFRMGFVTGLQRAKGQYYGALIVKSQQTMEKKSRCRWSETPGFGKKYDFKEDTQNKPHGFLIHVFLSIWGRFSPDQLKCGYICNNY